MQTTVQTPRATVRERSLVLSYLGLRRSVGVIGIMLPIVLAVGKMIMDGPGLLDSLSAYYHTDTLPIALRDVWVGSLCALGVFLLSYRYSWQDDIAGDLAGICAIGLALFPTAAAAATPQQRLIGQVHIVLSAGLLLMMAYFALVLFRKTDRREPPTPRKLRRNRLYLLCGLIILVCLALLGLMQVQPVPASIRGLHPAFWLQALADWAVGLAWFVKGETLLKDRPAR